jgi:hypothetical protein
MAEARPVVITGLVEGEVDQAVLSRLVAEAGATLGDVHGKSGKNHLLGQLERYNHAARLAPWVALVDLDRDADCAAAFRAKHLPKAAPLMCFRVVIQAVEAWLLADRAALASYLQVPQNKIPQQPEAEADPKRKLVDIARHSHSREIKDGLVPAPKTKRSVGPVYVAKLLEFVREHWRPEVAAEHSDSLRRCRERLRELVEGLS